MIPERVQQVFDEMPEVQIVVYGETRYYRGLRAFVHDHPELYARRYGEHSKGTTIGAVTALVQTTFTPPTP